MLIRCFPTGFARSGVFMARNDFLLTFLYFELANESCWKYNVFQTFFKRVIEQTWQNKAVLLAFLVTT